MMALPLDPCRHRAHAGGKRKRSRGLSRYEFLISVVVVGVIAAVMLERLIWYQEMAEKTTMEVTVMNMRSGLRLRMAELMALDRWSEVGDLTKQNPIKWVEPRPANYLGELNNPKLDDIPPGNWYFNLANLELVYVPQHQRFFEPGPAGEKAVYFQMHSLQPAKLKSDGTWTRAEGISLIQKGSYKWF